MTELVMVPTDTLVPYAMNSRTHSDEQVDKIAASIKEFGFLNPIITDGDNTIVAGHGRLLAAKKLKLEVVPVIEAKRLTEAQRRAYVIADNRLALDAGWDYELLKVELENLQELNFDLDVIGFDGSELEHIFEGWDSGLEIPDGDDEEPSEFKITVKGKPLDKDDVVNTIERALAESGIEGVEISA